MPNTETEPAKEYADTKEPEKQEASNVDGKASVGRTDTAAKHPSEEVQSLHGDHNVWSLSWSPCPFNGADHMLASGERGTIIWHYMDSNWSVLKELPNIGEGYIQSCAWSLDGKLLAVGGSKSHIAIWEYKESAGLDLFECVATIPGPRDQVIKSLSWNNEGSITSCALWTPNDTSFAVAGYKQIKIYHTQIQGDQDVKAFHTHTINERSHHKSGIKSISYWKNGAFMASAGADDSMKFWCIMPKKASSGSTTISIISGKELSSCCIAHHKVSKEPRGGFSSCDWSRCNNESIGYLIASACLFNDIYIFVQYNIDVTKNVKFRVGATKRDAHNGRIRDLKWHPKDAGLVASAGSDGIKIWKVKGKVVYSRKPNVANHKSSVRNGAPDHTPTKMMRSTSWQH